MNGGSQPGPAADDAGIHSHLQAVLASDGFAKSGTNRRLLTYLVQRHLQGSEAPKEADLAIDVFARDASFHGGDDSVVRVAVRGMRQKLLEYYAGPGKNDRLVFDVPKGSYRLHVMVRDEPAASDPPAEALVEPRVVQPVEPAAPEVTPRTPRVVRARWLAAACGLLAISLTANLLLYWTQRRAPAQDETLDQVRASALWHPIVQSARPVLFVLGDIFMYTQTDPATGRTQTVRDPGISSGEELRAFLASNPSLASDRDCDMRRICRRAPPSALRRCCPSSPRPAGASRCACAMSCAPRTSRGTTSSTSVR